MPADGLADQERLPADQADHRARGRAAAGRHPLAIFNGATNRDPGRFEAPHEFRVGRPNVREHIAFGRGIHSCPGAPLARSEGRVTVDRILSRTRDIRFSDQQHGPAGQRRFEYEPNWLVSGLRALHLEFTPVEG